MCDKERSWFPRGSYVLLILIAMMLVSGQPAATTLYQAVQSDGVLLCSTDAPLLALRARSRLDCSNLCSQLQGESYATFNYKQTQTNCELFNSAAFNCSKIPGCTLYQVCSGLILSLETNTFVESMKQNVEFKNLICEVHDTVCR